MERPALVMDDLKSGVQRGRLGLLSLTGATCFSGFQVRTTPRRSVAAAPAADAGGNGRNELVLALSELGGGWGFVCRLGDAVP